MKAAEKDLERAERSFEYGDYPATTFWCQQAVEKALKALLLLKAGSFPKAHSIRRLREELGEDLGLDEATWSRAYELTQYYFIARYPDLVEGPPDEVVSRESAERALWTCRAVVGRAKEAVEEALGGD
ncbi:MAG: HEPN domain-containing protein [Crenarchaeota archaeon]|nr:HEPN domain-containing protein [Thermoproteota archaeon]